MTKILLVAIGFIIGGYTHMLTPLPEPEFVDNPPNEIHVRGTEIEYIWDTKPKRFRTTIRRTY